MSRLGSIANSMLWLLCIAGAHGLYTFPHVISPVVDPDTGIFSSKVFVNHALANAALVSDWVGILFAFWQLRPSEKQGDIRKLSLTFTLLGMALCLAGHFLTSNSLLEALDNFVHSGLF